MSSTPSSTERELKNPGRHRGPPPVALAVIYVVLFMAGLIVSTLLAQGQHFPSVFAPPDQSARYFADHASAVKILAVLQFGAAIPLGIFAASVASRLQFLGMKVAGINIAFFGGISASLLLSLSAFAVWVLSQPGIADSPATARALHLLCFLAGGPGHIVAFGLLVMGISLVAGLQGFLPRWVMVFGIVVAGVAELSTLVLLIPAAGPLLPLARFPGFVWMILAGALLPNAKRAVGTAGTAPALRHAPNVRPDALGA